MHEPTQTFIRAINAAQRRLAKDKGKKGKASMPSVVHGQIDNNGHEILHNDTAGVVVHGRHYNVPYQLSVPVTPGMGNRGRLKISEAKVREAFSSLLRKDLPDHSLIVDAVDVTGVFMTTHDGHEVSLANYHQIMGRPDVDTRPAITDVLHQAYDEGAIHDRVVIAGWEKPHKQWCNSRCQPFTWCRMKEGNHTSKDLVRLLGTYERLLGAERIVTLQDRKDLEAAKDQDSHEADDMVIYMHAAGGAVHWACSNPKALQEVLGLQNKQNWRNAKTLSQDEALEYFGPDKNPDDPLYLQLASDGQYVVSVHRHGRHEDALDWEPSELKVLRYEERPEHRMRDALHHHATHGYHDLDIDFAVTGTKPVVVTVCAVVGFCVAIVDPRGHVP